ncbi:carboxypeptidase-like regulatory domain-containing protein [Novosphingobium lentum]|uniref:carboxypeptidase-like regulatory domain-containing protein n=1 Tax=Novosphingobium lentum TaxID=145287 RepID=UPI0012EDEEAE|nr:carboxypeptidase-like regulatory domain-containing protein [Novosphingobium lentum]
MPAADPLPKPAFGGSLAAAAAPVDATTGDVMAPLPTAPQPSSVTAPTTPSLRSTAIGGHTNRTAGEPPTFTDDDELILEIATPKHEMADTMTGYSARGAVYLPLGAIARFLDLAISVSDDGHYASGWAVDPKHTVALNLRDGTLVVEGRALPLGPADARAYDGEIYLRAERFADLFPLALDVSLRAQSVIVRPKVPFPYEQRLQREDTREQLASRQPAREKPGWPRETTPWRALAIPLTDIESRVASDTRYGTRVEGDLRMSGDLAFLTARLFASGSSRDGLTGANLELGRRDPDARLLGPLHATEFGLGDVSTAPMPMGLATAAGRGAMVTNAALDRASVFDTIDLTGDLPDGFEVELYRNGLLIDSTRTAVNGQYRFLRVPVEFGLNQFRLVLYGPQGQRRETVRQVNVGDGRLAKGDVSYAFGAVQNNRSLFDIHPREFIPGADFGAWRGVGQVQYGVTAGLTASLAGAVYDSQSGRHWLATAGVRTGVLGMALRLDAGLADHGRALEAGVGGNFHGVNIVANHAEYRGQFIDEVRSFSTDPLRRATDLSINGSLKLGGGDHPLVFPVYAVARQIDFADGRRATTVSLHQSFPAMAGFTLSNSLDYSRTRATTGGVSSRFSGTFDLATFSGSRTQYRAALDYTIGRHPRLDAAQLELDRSIDDRTVVKLSAARYFTAGQWLGGLSAQRRFDRFSLAFDGSYSTHPNQYSLTLRLGFGFGRNPLTDRWFLAPPGLSAGGAMAIRAYRDNNGDGRYDAGDVVLPEVEFGTATEHVTTDAHGLAFLPRLGDGQRTSVQVDPDTLPDITLAPVTKGIAIVPRAGRIHTTDFAMIALGEIDGTALFAGLGADKPVGGVSLQLLDGAGKVIAHTRSTSDGSFYFEQVRPGQYGLRIDPRQQRDLNIRTLDATIEVTVSASGSAKPVVVRIASTAEPASVQ